MDNNPLEIQMQDIELANSDNFDCCSRFIECSDAKKCVVKEDYAVFCRYREKLLNGICFYGKNSKNFDKKTYEKYESKVKNLSEREKQALRALCYLFTSCYNGLYIDTPMLHKMEEHGFISITKDCLRIIPQVASYDDVRRYVKSSEKYEKNFPKLNSLFSVLVEWLMHNNSAICKELTASYCNVKPEKDFNAYFEAINYYCLRDIDESSPDIIVFNEKRL